MTLKVGDRAPSFKLFNTEKKEVSLEDYKGKNLLILFFPQAFTGVCTTELCGIRDDISKYNTGNSEVVAISVDSLFTLGKFKEVQNLNFPLLSDFNKEASQNYGAFFEEFVFGMKGVSRRAAFVVDKDGIIRYAEVMPTAPELPNFQSIQETLASLN